MRDVAAIVEPAVDPGQLDRDILKTLIAIQDCERRLQAEERKVAATRDEKARLNIEIGRQLTARKRTVKHGNWESYLEKMSITSQSASNWMRLADYDGSQPKSPTEQNVGDLRPPTLADAGIDKRPRKSDEPDKRTLDTMRFMAGTVEAAARKRDEQPDPPSPDDADETDSALDQAEFINTLSAVLTKTRIRAMAPKARAIMKRRLLDAITLIEEFEDE